MMCKSVKKLVSATLAAAVMTAGTAFAQTNVIKINSFDDLRKIGADDGYPLDGSYELAADIDASSSRDEAFLPIGSESMPFSGTFDGKYHTIDGLYINQPELNDVGLFGFTQGAEIRGVILAVDSIIGRVSVGALVGQAQYTIVENCRTGGYVSGRSSIGGIAGFTSGATIKSVDSNSKCHASGIDDGWNSGTVGGLVGHAQDGIVEGVLRNTVITASYATGNITSAGGNAGGFIGYSKGINISKCYSTGNVNSSNINNASGGFIGQSDANGYDTISNSYATGENAYGYGFVQYGNRLAVINCYSTGRVYYSNNGFGDAVYPTNCFWDKETSNSPSNVASRIIGKSTAEMMLKATFTGWDFETVWMIDEGHDYPKLRGAGGHLPTLNYFAGVGGRIIGAPSQIIVSGADGSTVIALPNTGYVFVEWSDGVTASERIDRNITQSVEITAIFVPSDPRVLSYNAGEGGTIDGQASQTIPAGGSGSEVSAVANLDYRFVEWSDGVKTAARTDSKVQSNITVTAVFARVYTLRYTAETGGVINGPLTQTVISGDAGISVYAVANAGYRFVSWSDGLTSAERRDVHVTTNISVTANFALVQYTLRYILGVGGRGIVGDPEQTVSQGSSGTEVYVLAETGYTFAGWSDGSTDNPRNDKNVQRDITVTAYFADPNGGIVSVASSDRIIPAVKPNEEATVIPPVTVLSGEFTAGPNPVSRQSGVVNFFRQGKRVSNSELRIYDANGNVINKVKISDNVIGSQARRIVGSWDLTDKQGRQVSEGTYLVKGVIKTSDGKSEKVSVILGVR